MDRFKIIALPDGRQAKNDLKKLPNTSGVYSFYSGKEAEARLPLIYIGKAADIRDRVRNHFQQPSYGDNLFIDKVIKIGFFETGSEIEALILEENLIKKYQPKFNVMWRDDKNYFYVAIVKNSQKIPYVFITHQPKTYRGPSSIYIGPFVEGGALKKTLRFLRKVFPYYTSKNHSKSKCTWCHLNLCPGPDPDLIEYKKNVRKLVLILQGKRNAVLNSLKEEMKQRAKQKEFEKAARIRDKIHSLEQIMAHTHVINSQQALEGPSFQWPKTQQILQGLLGIKKIISRIECYDVSNIQGNQATGSMVIFVNGKPDKNLYRKFKINPPAGGQDKPNDIAMLKETLQRRLSHKEWQYPDVMLIDGGIAQLNIAVNEKNQRRNTKRIKVMSIAKRNRELYIENREKPILLKTLTREVFNLILQLDDEAHRFAIAYHKKLRKKQLFS